MDDAVDLELHSLIKCVPKIITSNHLDVSAEKIDSFMAEEAQNLSLEELASKVNLELDVAANLAKRRLALTAKVKESNPYVADDIWGAIAMQTNIELGDRTDKFRNIVENKKKALALLET